MLAGGYEPHHANHPSPSDCGGHSVRFPGPMLRGQVDEQIFITSPELASLSQRGFGKNMLRDVGIQLDGFEEKLRSFPASELILKNNMHGYPPVLDAADIHHGKGLEKFPAFGKTYLFL